MKTSGLIIVAVAVAVFPFARDVTGVLDTAAAQPAAGAASGGAAEASAPVRELQGRYANVM